MSSSSSKVKRLVIIGYVLVVAVMAIGIISMYNNLVDFSEKRIKDEDLTELLIAGNAISKLYEIESSQNLFNAQSAENYFSKYDSILPIVHQQIDSLKHLSKDSSRVVKLDSIEILLESKNKNLREIVGLLDSIQKAPQITRETVSTIVPRRLNTEITDYLESRNINIETDTMTTDTTVVYGDRRGFIDRVRDVFIARSDSTVVVDRQQTVLPKEQFKSVIDTVVNMVRYSERLNLENQRKFQYILLERQNQMAGTNAQLTAQIDELLKGIEQEELEKSLRLVQDRDNAISKAQRIAYLVGWLAVLIALIFGFLLLTDINRSQRYRKQLELSNKRISELLKSREQLMLAVSHDIKAPMSSVLGYIELMRTELPKNKKQLYLGNMKNSSEHVLQLVANLLDFHKLESGTMKLKESNVNFHDLVENTIDSFRPIAVQKNLKYVTDNRLNRNLVGVGDPYIIRQILSNVISNAIKYTFEGMVFVNASSLEHNSQLRLRLSVKDTGIGISKEDQDIIFQEFKQLETDDSLGTRIEGSGLGLAITQRLVNELNGKISVNSEKGKGSEFIIELPIKVESLNSLKVNSSSENIDYDLENISVLMVDDDSLQLKMASEMLLLKKVDVITEINPENVENILFGNHFDIFFVDIQMPQMNGFELVKKIRELKNYKDTPMIALSAKSDISTSDVQSAGFTDFLTKPFTSEALYETVFNYVKGDGARIAVVEDQYINNEGIHALIGFVREDKTASIEILDAFVKDTTANINQLGVAFKKKDTEAASRLAHKMLPLIQMMGDSELTSYLQQLEKGVQISSENEKKILESVELYIKDAEALRKKIGES